MKKLLMPAIIVISVCVISLGLPACSSSSGSGYKRASVHYGYRGYRGRPWGYGGGYYPVYPGGGGGVDPDWGVQAPSRPIATPMPDMGMPDFGGMDFGGFDF